MDDVIIDAKNPSKQINDIYINFRFRDNINSPYYYLVNELVQVGDCIYVSSRKYDLQLVPDPC